MIFTLRNAFQMASSFRLLETVGKALFVKVNVIDIDTFLVMRASPDVGTFFFRSDNSAPVKDLPLFDNRHEACCGGHEMPSRKKTD